MPKGSDIKMQQRNEQEGFYAKLVDNPVDKTFRQLYFVSKFILPDYRFPVELAPFYKPYPRNQPIVFGHYCLPDGAAILQPNMLFR